LTRRNRIFEKFRFRRPVITRENHDRLPRIAGSRSRHPVSDFAAPAPVSRHDRGGGTGLGVCRRGLDESFATHGGPMPCRMFAQGQ